MQYKWKVFKDYYLKYAILAVIAVAGLVYFCYDRINHKENALQVIMMDVRCPMEEQEEFEKLAGERIGIDSQKEYVDLSFCHSEEMLVTMMVNDKVDIFLMSEAYFEVMSSQECLAPLNKILANEGIYETGEVSEECGISGEGEIYGFSVLDNPWLNRFGLETTGDIIIGIAANSPNVQNACDFVTSFVSDQ